MKTSKIIILALISTLLISCGGKKDDEAQQGLNGFQRGLNQQQSQNQNPTIEHNSNMPSTEQGPVTEQLNNLYFSVRSSGIDMQPLDDGNTIYIKCQSFKVINELNLCRIGYTAQEVEIGNSYINKGYSEEILHNLQSEALAQSMLNEEPLAINCKQKCQISQLMPR